MNEDLRQDGKKSQKGMQCNDDDDDDDVCVICKENPFSSLIVISDRSVSGSMALAMDRVRTTRTTDDTDAGALTISGIRQILSSLFSSSEPCDLIKEQDDYDEISVTSAETREESGERGE